MSCTQITSPLTTDLILFSVRSGEALLERISKLQNRFEKYRRCFIIERPFVHSDVTVGYNTDYLNNALLISPYIPDRLNKFHRNEMSRILIEKIIRDHKITHYQLWYNDTEAYQYTDHLLVQPLTLSFPQEPVSSFPSQPTCSFTNLAF